MDGGREDRSAGDGDGMTREGESRRLSVGRRLSCGELFKCVYIIITISNNLINFIIINVPRCR